MTGFNDLPRIDARRVVLSLAVAALAVGLGSWLAPAWAGAATASWRLTARAVPTDFAPGGEGQFQLHVENVGDAATNGEPITVVDQLPPGVVMTAAGALESEESSLEVPGPWGECSGAGTRTVTCTYEPSRGPIAPFFYDGVGNTNTVAGIGIDVHVEPSAEGALTDTATVSGGGAAGSVSDTATAFATAAEAPFGIASLRQWSTNADGSPDTRAGSHPYELTTNVMLNLNKRGDSSGSLLRDLHVGLPAGFSGNPNATPKCTRAEFDIRLVADDLPLCPSDTQVGVALAYIALNQAATVPVYNLVPPRGMPAQFGIAYGTIKGFLDAGVQTGGSYGLTIDLSDFEENGGLSAFSLSLWGNPADPSHDELRFYPGIPYPSGELGTSIPFGEPISPPKPFLTLPTSCGVQSLAGSADSWANPLPQSEWESVPFASTDASNNPVSLEGCQALGFNPSVSVRPEASSPDTPTGLSVDLAFPQPESVNSTAEANLKEAVVQLPAGMAVSPSAANGLGACTPEEIGLDNANPVSCPQSSKRGTIEITTPLLEHPLTGSVFVAQQGNLPGAGVNPFGSLLALYVVAEGSGVLVKFPGSIALDPTTGQLTARFGEDPVTTVSTGTRQLLPPVAVSDVKMVLFGGPRSPLVTPPACGTYASTAQLSPWSGNAPTELTSSFTLGTGCATGAFAPSFTAGGTNPQAGAFTPFGVTISRQDGEQRLAGVQVTAPPGVLGVLKSAPRCPEPQAAQGTCGAESEIGEATVAAGPGPDPFWVKGGRVYLTGPYKGAPFGLSVVVPAVAGPFNLGEGGRPIVVRAAVGVDPHTAQITVTSDPLPSILQGIPLDIKTVNVSINRPGFMFNPTDCEPLSVAGTIGSTQGATANVSGHFQAANCAALPFHPVFSVSTQAGTSKHNGASLTVKGTFPAGEANVHSVAVVLPKQLPARLTTIQQACPEAVFNANPASCPAGSNIGTATASTPILATAATGPAYLVSHGGAAFPDVVAILQAEGVTVDLVGSIDIKKGITSSTFATVPDVPISTFTLTLPEGPHSGLAAVVPAKAKGSLCGQTLAMPFTITGQNGAVVKQPVKIAVTGCPRVKAKTKKHGKAKTKTKGKGKKG